jgi:alkanesulfonate monooxygenase SsuD/methylene tetrahydromethanopterin reductase-like flavin-dependent oxidoreductase (luciferase family)
MSNQQQASSALDQGHDLKFGVFITPAAQPAMKAVEMAVVADRAGLDLATFQDHPYQPAFYDTWTLIAYIAARTEHIHLSPNVLNLPLRQPAVMARSAAGLDRLTGGRIELGLGAGAFWDGIVAMGGEKKTPGQSIEALEEAIQIIREIWATEKPGGARMEGTYYQVRGAKRGPAPSHPIKILVGAYKPRILRMTGRVADGWLPSLGYLPNGPASLPELIGHINEGAESAGRDPADIHRYLNISGRFAQSERAFLDGPPKQWAEDLAGLALNYGVSGFILAADDQMTIERFAADVAPATRELVAAGRAS